MKRPSAINLGMLAASLSMLSTQWPRLLLLAGVLSAGSIVQGDEVDNLIEAHRKWLRIPGLSVAVIRDGKIVMAKGYGLANLETKTPASPETVYKLGSTSKQFMAAAAMTLVQDGKLSLDDRVTKFLAGAPEAWQSITVRHLLTHTSGLGREFPNFDPFKLLSDGDSIKAVYDLALGFDPGAKWAYSNIGYYCLAEVIRQASGQPWADFVQARIFAPAGMTATRSTTAEVVPNRAAGYDQRNGKLQNAENWLVVRPSGAFISNVLDFAKWEASLRTEKMLSTPSKTQMWSPVQLNDGKPYGYGFGWFLDQFNGHRRIHHGGGVPGFSSDFERFVDDGLSVVVMANMGNRDLGELAVRVAAHYLPALVTADEKPIVETEPSVMELVRAVVNDLAQGKIDSGKVDAKLAAGLAQDLKAGFGETLKALGPIRSISLLERKMAGGKRYRLTYRYLTLNATCTIGPDGKIADLAIFD